MSITIQGANGTVITLPSAPTSNNNTFVESTALGTTIDNDIITGKAQAFELATNSENPDTTLAAVGIISDAGAYQLPSAYKYIVVADDDKSSTSAGIVTLNNNGFQSNTISVLAGRQSGINYNAGNEAGKLINTAGAINFDGVGKTGKWEIFAGDGNSTIKTTDANNQIVTGSGQSTIVLGRGVNMINSGGQDTITGGGSYQTVTLRGSNSSVTLGDGASITDIASGSTISVGKNSTVASGSSSSITYNEGLTNELRGGKDDTIVATGGSSLKAIHGSGNNYSVDQDFTLLNGSDSTSIKAGGQTVVFGSSDSKFDISATGTKTGLFVADVGNETLNASGSTVGMSIYANTVPGSNTNFVAVGGSGSDIMVGGTGNSTFTGGAGSNLFMFNKDTAQDGKTLITDFARGDSSNKIGLFGYGLDTNSLTQLLQTSQNNTNGDAVLSLQGHTVTIEGVSVSQLNVDKFMV